MSPHHDGKVYTPDWTIQTCWRRRWHDGTEFTIRDARRGVHLTVTSPVGLKAHSHHPDVFMAKAHVEELLASMTNPDLEAYRDDDAESEQLELA